MFADSFDPVIAEIKIGADEEVPDSIKGVYYLYFRTVPLAQRVGAMLDI